MYNVRSWWLGKARALPSGSSEKIAHIQDGTGKTESVLIYNTPTGYGAKCFRRGTSDWVSKVGVNLHEVSKALEESGKSNLPEDLTKYNPLATDNATRLANTYLLARNIDPTMLSSKEGVYLSPSRMRLVIKGVDTQGIVGFTGRDITEQHKAKAVVYYLEGRRLSDYVLTTEAVHGRILITEDVLSAYKIAEMERRTSDDLVSEALSLNGTQGSASISLHCMDKDVTIWLDGDQAGMQGAVKLYRDLQFIAKSVKIITGLGDPKDYSTTEIHDIIWSSTCSSDVKINIQEFI